MKILDITPITDADQFPVKRGTLQFLQDAHKETVAAIVQGLIGPLYDPSVVYVLIGVINSGVYPFYNTTSGVVFYNGEIYYVDSTTFTASGSNVGIFQLVVSQYTTDADPVTFTDAVPRNVHNIRKIQVVQGVAGTGISNLAQAFYLQFSIPPQLDLEAPTTGGFAGNQVVISGAYPNLRLFVPLPPTNTHPVLAMGSLNVGDPTPGASFTVTFASVGLTTYSVFGSFISNGGSWPNDSSLTWSIKNRTNTSFQIFIREYTGSGMNVAFEWMIVQQ